MLKASDKRNRFRVNTALALAAMGALSATPLFAQNAPQPNADPSTAAPATPAPIPADGGSASSVSGITPAPSLTNSATEATPAAIDIQTLLSSTVSAVLTPDPANPLSNQLARADQERLQDLANSTALNETVAQLQKAFQEKYGTPLDLRQNQQAVFPEDSFRVGVAMAIVRDEPEVTTSATPRSSSTATTTEQPAAQQAAAVSAPDSALTAPPPPNTSASPETKVTAGDASDAGGASRASANGTTPSNPPANASSDTLAVNQSAGAHAAPKLTRRVSVTVPESNGLPETGLKLANQAGAWKIDVPNGVTPQSLEQSLQQQLQLAMNMEWPDDANVAGQMIARHVLLALASEGSTGQIGNAVRPTAQPAAERIQRPPNAEVPVAAQADTDIRATEPATRPVRQTYREKREAERAARETKRAAQQKERQEKQQQETQAQPAAPETTTPAQKGTNRRSPERSGAYERN